MKRHRSLLGCIAVATAIATTGCTPDEGPSQHTGPSPWGTRPPSVGPAGQQQSAVLIEGDARTGAEMGETALPMMVASKPVVDGDKVLVEGHGACVDQDSASTVLVAVDASDGKIAWQHPIPNTSCNEVTAPLVADHVVIASEPFVDCSEPPPRRSSPPPCPMASAFDVNTGDPVWHYAASVLFAYARGFVGASDQGLVNIVPSTGRARWTIRLTYKRFSTGDAAPQLLAGAGAGSLGFIDTAVSFKSATRTLGTAIDLTTGRTRWQYVIPNGVHLFVTADVFGYYNDRRMVSLDTSSGREFWYLTYGVGGEETTVFAEEGAIYVDHVDGTETYVEALDVRTRGLIWVVSGVGSLEFVDPEDGMVFTAKPDGHRHVVDSMTGDTLYQYSDGIVPMAAAGGRLFATSGVQHSSGH